MLPRSDFPLVLAIDIGNDKDVLVLARVAANKCYLETVRGKGDRGVNIHNQWLRLPTADGCAVQDADRAIRLGGNVEETFLIVREPQPPT